MRIVLSGIETNNKGAELMLYAILQEIERTFPDAEVYVPVFAIRQGLDYIKTSVRLLDKPFAKMGRFAIKSHLLGILRRLHLPYNFLCDSYPVKNIDYFLDASGFAFSDQCQPTDSSLKFWEEQLEGYGKQGTKIIFLPQAFGPANMFNTQRKFSLLERYANIIMPREKISLAYLLNYGISAERLRMFTDFTSLVEGVIPPRYKYLSNYICIIPNKRMIDRGIISLKGYIDILTEIIRLGVEKGHNVYLLNHEGKEDKELAYQISAKLNNRIEVVSGLNALEVKGLISTSYLCVSSRFHGVASALNSCVPCLATSWSHKYAELFNDYGLSDCVLNLSDTTSILDIISDYLDCMKNKEIREKLIKRLPEIKRETQNMWNLVWNI